MRSLRLLIATVLILAFSAPPVLAGVWPQAGEVNVSRSFAGADGGIEIGDACHVTWTVRPVSRSLDGLFLSEQIPAWVEVSNVTARVGGSAVAFYVDEGDPGDVEAGLVPYHFVFWDPESGQYDLELSSSQTLTLEYDLSSQQSGSMGTDSNGWFGRLLGSGSHAVGGYLEDGPLLTFGDTPLTLQSFTVADAGDHLALRWVLHLEGETENFRLQRGESAEPGASAPLAAMDEILQGPGDYRFDDYSARPGRDYWYWLAMLDENGAIRRYLGPARGRLSGVTPPVASLSNFPNPFNPKTTLRFALEESARVELAIYDAQGRRLRVLATGVLPAGAQSIDWDGRDDAGRALPSGQYFARLLRAGHAPELHKLTLLR
ncbi:MAG: hypothetical protein H6694_07600 [Candidatus Latescibacteria bacterium]|nr:hypothetical protein [Candidatus Latescibacterota bacterium]